MLSGTRICLITTGQPSTNPRLIKEADALADEGYQVHVIYAHWAKWAARMDASLLSRSSWTYSRVGGDPGGERMRYWWTRLRHRFSRRALSRGFSAEFLENQSLSRVTPELEAAAKTFRAHLYIAHNLGALPAAVSAARANGAQAGFDAEDFHSSMLPADKKTREDELIEIVEARLLRSCIYVSAAAPGIAAAYARKYGIPEPETILNVFPLLERPAQFRLGDPLSALKLYWFSQTIGCGRGLEDVVRAMSLLGDESIELHLRGEWSSGYQASLFRLAKSLGVATAQIHYHPPERADRMVELAAEYDVGLALEQHTSFNKDVCISNKMFTHLLAGNAVAATNTQGQKAVISRIGQAGFSYEAGNAAELAAGLRRWSEHRQSLEVARREAWSWGSREYNWDFEKKKFLAIIEGVLKQSLAGMISA